MKRFLLKDSSRMIKFIKQCPRWLAWLVVPSLETSSTGFYNNFRSQQIHCWINTTVDVCNNVRPKLLLSIFGCKSKNHVPHFTLLLFLNFFLYLSSFSFYTYLFFIIFLYIHLSGRK